MVAYARKFGEDEELWAATGLLHDLDYERYPDLATGHPRKALELFEERGYPQELIDAVAGHATSWASRARRAWPRRSTRSTSCRASCRLRATCARTASTGMTPKSVKKKLKQPSFAAGVNRDEVREGAEELGVDFDEHVAFVIAAMEERADELGLGPREAPSRPPAPSDASMRACHEGHHAISTRSPRRSAAATSSSLRGRARARRRRTCDRGEPRGEGGAARQRLSASARVASTPGHRASHAVSTPTRDQQRSSRSSRHSPREALSIDEAFLTSRGTILAGTPVEIAERCAPCSLRSACRSAWASHARTSAPGRERGGQAGGLLVVPPDGELESLHPLPLERLAGVGPITAARPHDAGLRSVGQAAGSRRARSSSCSAAPRAASCTRCAKSATRGACSGARGGARAAPSPRWAGARAARGRRRERRSAP